MLWDWRTVTRCRWEQDGEQTGGNSGQGRWPNWSASCRGCVTTRPTVIWLRQRTCPPARFKQRPRARSCPACHPCLRRLMRRKRKRNQGRFGKTLELPRKLGEGVDGKGQVRGANAPLTTRSVGTLISEKIKSGLKVIPWCSARCQIPSWQHLAGPSLDGTEWPRRSSPKLCRT
jgi:hypothetical protein